MAAANLLALAAGAGAIVMVLTATGDALLLGVLLGFTALDAIVGGIAVVVGLGVLGRWGSSSLAALAGGQAVLSAAGWTGSAAAVLSSWGGALALLLATPPRLVPVLAFGLAAAQLVAGPAVGTGSIVAPLGLRIAVSSIAIAGAWVCSRHVPERFARPVAMAAASVAMALAFVA